MPGLGKLRRGYTGRGRTARLSHRTVHHGADCKPELKTSQRRNRNGQAGLRRLDVTCRVHTNTVRSIVIIIVLRVSRMNQTGALHQRM